MVVGSIIGASIFVQPALITARVPSIAGMFGVWATAGLLSLFGALICAELASAYPHTGGVYVFLNRAYSPAMGFLWGWAMFWSMHSGIVAAVAVVFARYVGFFFPLGDTGLRLVAIAVILLLSAVNYVGVRHGSTLQTAFTIGKVAAVAAIVLVGFVLGSRLPTHFQNVPGAGSIGASAYVLALVAGLFAYGGWHVVTYTSGETVDPERTIPRALVLGLLVVTAAYIALNAVYLYILPLDVVARSDRIAADAANALLGSGGGAVMAALVVFSTFGALSGIVLTGPRVYYAMAQDGLLFRWLAEPHPRFRTPHRSIVGQAIWSSVLVATGTYVTLFTRVIFTEWIFFGLMAAGLMVLRRRPDYRPTYRIRPFPLVPIAFILATAVIVCQHVLDAPRESAFGLAVVILGLPAYLIWVRGRTVTEAA
jgi:APA family basic amino acid/polyamine antiporter